MEGRGSRAGDRDRGQDEKSMRSRAAIKWWFVIRWWCSAVVGGIPMTRSLENPYNTERRFQNFRKKKP